MSLWALCFVVIDVFSAETIMVGRRAYRPKDDHRLSILKMFIRKYRQQAFAASMQQITVKVDMKRS